jgi:hypothetical protein
MLAASISVVNPPMKSNMAPILKWLNQHHLPFCVIKHGGFLGNLRSE